MKLSKVIDQIKTLLECEVRMYRRSIQAIYGAYNAGPEGTAWTLEIHSDNRGNKSCGLNASRSEKPAEVIRMCLNNLAQRGEMTYDRHQSLRFLRREFDLAFLREQIVDDFSTPEPHIEPYKP